MTFRVLYTGDKDCSQNKWIAENRADELDIELLESYIKANGRELEMLEFGSIRYSVHGMSTMLDNDCMNKEAKTTLKYASLRPDCKIYSKWDDPGSLIF